MNPAAPPAPLTLRVTVSDGWRTVTVQAPPDGSAGEVKRMALAAAGLGAQREAVYEVKYGGALLADGEALRTAGVPDGAALVVLPRRRRPVR